MTEAERWEKLRQIVQEVVDSALDARDLKKKPKIMFAAGRWIGITEDQMSAWQAAYGAVDINKELSNAAAWIVSNPSLAPKSNYPRFLNTWLSKCQNRASIHAIPASRGPGLKLCSYCEQVAKAQVNGIWYCATHTDDAYDRKPIPHMRGVVAKPVAGAD